MKYQIHDSIYNRKAFVRIFFDLPQGYEYENNAVLKYLRKKYQCDYKNVSHATKLNT